MSTIDKLTDNDFKIKLSKFIQSFMERKIIFLIYTIIEKWVLLKMFIPPPITNNLLIFIFGKDIIVLIILGLISFEKIKVSINK